MGKINLKIVSYFYYETVNRERNLISVFNYPTLKFQVDFELQNFIVATKVSNQLK